jgi:hypothetical protein
MVAVFAFFVFFSLRFIFVSLQISMFRIDAKQAKKALFSHQSEKNFASVSLRSENDGAPYQNFWRNKRNKKFHVTGK